ncbi:serine hydrolase [SAR202 cluster bacterium JH702]|uniref:Serine hydrolase n=2 Tax=Candidatus Lucifugimonas marina TaxID=3038979 RepID=A0ABD4XSQ9_9CHLR|nr:serine hydrolase [SAR202 cluster bacterium JH702]
MSLYGSRRMNHQLEKYSRPAAMTKLLMPVFFLILASVFGCSDGSSDAEKRADPEKVAEIQKDLQTVLDEWRENERITGASLSVFSPPVGDIDLVSGSSKLSIDPERFPDTPLGSDQPMFIGDITHLLVAAIVVQLANEGSLEVQQTIDTWFPAIENSSQITVRNLLEHTSGVPIFYTEEFLDVLYEQSPNSSKSPDEVIAIAASEGSFFEPNSQYGYSKTNFIILGRIIELVTESTLEFELRDRFLNPLDMSDTYLAGIEKIPSGIPLGYEYAGLSSDAPTVIDGHVPQTPATSVITAEWASGAVVSTTGDLIKLVQGIFESQEYEDLLSELLRPAAHAAQSSGPIRIESGAGVFIWQDDDEQVVGQFGFLYPFSAQFMYWPKSKTVITVIANEVDSSRNPNSNFQLPVIENLTTKAKTIIDAN